jgi:uncharacterized protein
MVNNKKQTGNFGGSLLKLYVDADGCPVREEVFRVAARYKLTVFLVANQGMKIPLDPSVKMIVVPGNFDAADDWIVETVEKDDIVITADILLADRCVKKGTRVLGHKGQELTEENIGEVVASREIMAHLRQTGESKGGPAPFEKKNRSQFLSTLDRIIQDLRRKEEKKT